MGFKLKHIFKGVGKVIKPVNKILTPMLGAAVGTMLGGPAGGILGASLAGASMRGGHNRLKGALHGAATGTLYQALAPTIANSLGATMANSPIISSVTGLSSPSLLHQLGMSSAPELGGGLGFMGNAGHRGILPNLSMGKMIGSGFNALQGIQNPVQPFEQPQQSQMMEFPEMGGESYDMHYPGQGGQSFNDQHQDYSMMPFEAAYPKSPVSPLDILRKLSPKIPFGKTQHEMREKRENKEEDSEKAKKHHRAKFSQGGKVKLVKKERTGYIRESDSGGQDDDIDMDIPPNAYVMNGMDVSLYGDGNTENGVKILKKWEASLPKNKFSKMHDNPRIKPVKARVSNGEYVLKPSSVIAIGKGSVDKGVKIIDNMRDNLRKQKGVKAILPPRTKSMKYYMKGGV
jgi:hypothetical protein